MNSLLQEMLQPKHKIDVNRSQPDGANALFFAAQNGHTSTVDLLLKNGANSEHCLTKSSSELKEFVLHQSTKAQQKMNLFLTMAEKEGADISSISISPLQMACIMDITNQTMIHHLIASIKNPERLPDLSVITKPQEGPRLSFIGSLSR